MDKKISALLEKLNGEQVGKLLSMFYTDVFMREIAFNEFAGEIDDEKFKMGTLKTLKRLVKKIRK